MVSKKLGGMSTSRNRERTTERILDSARAEFGIRGFAGARIERIARNAGITKALVFYYFKSKSDLYAELVDRLFLDLEARLFPALAKTAPEDLPAALVSAYFDVFDASPDTIRLFIREVTDGGAAIVARMRRPDRAPYLRRLVDEVCRIRGGSPETAGAFILSAMSLILYSFIARDLFGKMFPDRTADEYRAERRVEIVRVLSAAYPAVGAPPRTS